MPDVAPEIVADLAPGGVLRAALNLGNAVLAQGPPAAPAGVTVDLAREVAVRLGTGVEFACFTAAVDAFHAAVSTPGAALPILG